MCDRHYYFYNLMKACWEQSTMIVAKLQPRIYQYTVMGRYGITLKMIYICRKKKILLMEDDWLKDLQGDVYRCRDKKIFDGSVHQNNKVPIDTTYRPAMT